MRRALQYQRITGAAAGAARGGPLAVGRAASCTRAPSPAASGSAGIPSISESVAVARDAALAEYEGGRIHICHVSAAETAEEIRRAKARGVRITAEVTPHHLTLTDAAVASLDPSRHKMNPPAARAVRPRGPHRRPGRRHHRLRRHRPRAPRVRREGGPVRGGALRRHRARDGLRRVPHPPGAHRPDEPGAARAAHGRGRGRRARPARPDPRRRRGRRPRAGSTSRRRSSWAMTGSRAGRATRPSSGTSSSGGCGSRSREVRSHGGCRRPAPPGAAGARARGPDPGRRPGGLPAGHRPLRRGRRQLRAAGRGLRRARAGRCWSASSTRRASATRSPSWPSACPRARAWSRRCASRPAG